MSNIYIKKSMIVKPFSKLLILLLFLSLYSCKKSSISKENSEHIETRENLTHDEQEWVLLKYSDGTYGAEINDKIILSNYENKIYLMGYSGDYVFKTQKGEDWLFYNLSGELLFTIPNAKHVKIENLQDEYSQNIIKLIYSFEDILKQVTDKNEPSILARYLIDLAKAYSSFYNENKIICEDKELQDSRVFLSFATGKVLKQGAGLLGIEMPEKM
jgi:hypothetical protein